MKSFILLLLFIFQVNSNSQDMILATAISEVVKNYNERFCQVFDFIVFELTSMRTWRILSETVRLSELPTNVIKIPEKGDKIVVSHSAVLMFDSLQSFKLFNDRAKLVNAYGKHLEFIVYISDLPGSFDIKNFHTSLIIRSSFILNNGFDDVSFGTFLYFEKSNCKTPVLSLVNEISRRDKKWIHSRFFVDKTANFNGCNLTIGYADDDSPFTTAIYGDDGKVEKMEGYAIGLTKAIGQSLNYESWYTPLTRNKEKKIYESKTNVKLTFIIRVSSMQKIYANHMQSYVVTHGFYSNDDIILVSRYKPYSMLEKIFVPFDDATWIWLGSLLAIGFVVIVFVNKWAPKIVRFLVFGSKVTTPLLNFM
jgi:hypothetical protein